MTFRLRLFSLLACGMVLAVAMSASGQASTDAQQTESVNPAIAVEINAVSV